MLNIAVDIAVVIFDGEVGSGNGGGLNAISSRLEDDDVVVSCLCVDTFVATKMANGNQPLVYCVDDGSYIWTPCCGSRCKFV